MVVLKIWCLVNGTSLSNAFSVNVDASATVDDLKKAIKVDQSPDFDHINPKNLTLWKVAFTARDSDEPILLDIFKHAKKLLPREVLSSVFTGPPDGDTYIIVQRPPSATQNDPEIAPEIAILRKQLSDMEQLHAEITSSANVNTATIDEMKRILFQEFPQYTHDDFVEIFVYTGFPKPERVRDDGHLRNVLRACKSTSKSKLTISLESPSKNFSAWTFKDVCTEYSLSDAVEPSIAVIPRFTEIQAAPLDSKLHIDTLDQLMKEVELRNRALQLQSSNEATKSIVVASFLLSATRLFEEDLFLESQRNLSGRRGHGPVDFSVHSRQSLDHTLGVTEVKKEDIRQGVAQNIVQLEAALTSKKRKRGRHDIEGQEEPGSKMKSYGIVTDSKEWYFLECTLDDDDVISYRMSKVPEAVNYEMDWRADAKVIFQYIIWLFARMRDELPGRERYSPRKLTSSPSDKKTQP
ncbi:hypothetical protein BGX31_003187 [Mortierella sp. GBA43]|nr:hypothetical protein BGX31_003187 [Mortierella sp. GBA43]